MDVGKFSAGPGLGACVGLGGPIGSDVVCGLMALGCGAACPSRTGRGRSRGLGLIGFWFVVLTEDGWDGGILMMGLGLGRGAFAGPVVDFFELALRVTIVIMGSRIKQTFYTYHLMSDINQINNRTTRGNSTSWKRKKVSSFANAH